MPRSIGLQKMLDRMDASHYVEHPQHGRQSLEQLRAELTSFQSRASDDPLLFAYELRDECTRWFSHFLNILAWTGQMIEKDRQGIAIEELA